MAISTAQQAKADKYLDSLVRTSRYGIVSWREYVDKTLADGGKVESAQVDDDATRVKAQAQYDLMNRGFNVPWGNASHPKTVAAQRIKTQLAGRITKTEYRLVFSGDDRWTVITKTAYDYAVKR